MLRFAADENLKGAIARGLLRIRPKLDLIRVQDTTMFRSSDPELLKWAGAENRILLSHDIRTLRKFAEDRVRANLPMPGLVEVGKQLPIRVAIEDIFSG